MSGTPSSVLKNVASVIVGSALSFTLALSMFSAPVQALELDWSGQFRSEAHYLKNYNLGNGAGADPARIAAGGYYIPGGGEETSSFQTLFLKLKPKVVVNDNIYIRSEFWVGDPVFGLFGNAAPYSVDQRQFYSSQSRGSVISAQRFWADILTEVGTVQVGRAPLHWGLGIFWNNGDGLWDRYESTGDTIRLVSKFGAFSVIPSATKYSMGNSIGGSFTCDPINVGACGPAVLGQGGGGISDYSLAFKYENLDDEFDGGVNFVKRVAGPAQGAKSGYLGISQAGVGMNFNTWDIYGRKKFGKFTVAGELPITSGMVGGLKYETYALAIETQWKISDAWETGVKVGHAPGQPSSPTSDTDKLRAYFFNPNYHIGLIMFNYQLANFAGPNASNDPNISQGALVSAFDNPITNANYLSWNGAFHTDKWTFKAGFVTATARETAQASQGFFYNSVKRRLVANQAGNQATSLGWEMDYGTSFQWDDNFQAGFDFGWYFPGDYLKFSNTASPNTTNSVFAGVAKAGITF